MYSRKVINRNLEEFAAREGWMPEPHSQDEVNEFKEYIDSITHTKSNSRNTYIGLSTSVTSRKAKEIRNWIANEQVLCCASNDYWESRYCFIRDEQGSIVPFRNRMAQMFFDSVLGDLEDAGSAIELLVLQGRQAGIGTKALLKIAHRSLFHPQSSSLVGAITLEKLELFGQVIETARKECPWWLVPWQGKKGVLGNGSKIKFHAANQRSGFLEGFTANNVFLSDVGCISNPVKRIEEDLLRGLFASSRSLTVFQASAGKTKGWFESIWRQAKEYWPQGKARFMPVFVPWYLCSDVYPTERWLEHNPIPPNWKPNRHTKHHARDAEQYIEETPIFKNFLGPNWRMPEAQQWFWEYIKKKKIVDPILFSLQMPANEEQALGISDHETDDIDEIFPNPIDIQNKISQYSGARE
jgi:hypothetical protein